MEYFFHHWFNPKDIERVKCRKRDQFSPHLQNTDLEAVYSTSSIFNFFRKGIKNPSVHGIYFSIFMRCSCKTSFDLF